MQERRLRGVHAAAQGCFDQIDVVETFGPVQIDDEVYACATHAVANGEMIVAILGGRRLDHCNVSRILSGGGLELPSLSAIARGRSGALPSSPTE